MYKQRWLQACIQKHRFCTDENGMKTCYISSDSDGSQNPLQDKICMLRVKKSRVYGDNVPHAIGVCVC